MVLEDTFKPSSPNDCSNDEIGLWIAEFCSRASASENPDMIFRHLYDAKIYYLLLGSRIREVAKSTGYDFDHI